MRYLLLLLLVQPAMAQTVEVDAPCWIYKAEQSERSDWCGVAVSRSVIVSCGHHGKTGDVRVEFPIGKYGSTNRISVPAIVVKLDRQRDLSIISYEAPQWVWVRPVKIGRVKGPAEVRGFLRGSNASRKTKLGRAGLVVDGFPVVEILTDCESGMSGSPLMDGDTLGGILIGSGGGVSHMVDPETIEAYLRE